MVSVLPVMFDGPARHWQLSFLSLVISIVSKMKMKHRLWLPWGGGVGHIEIEMFKLNSQINFLDKHIVICTYVNRLDPEGLFK